MEGYDYNYAYSFTVYLFYLAGAMAVGFTLSPVVVYYNPWLLKAFFFMNWLPSFGYDPSKPKECGLDNTRNFSLHVEEGVDIGVWHILPQGTSLEDKEASTPQEEDFQDGLPVILYLHGNAGHRGANVRVEVYKALSQTNLHVISIDYRGYGESTGEPTEDGLVQDGLATYRWLRQMAPLSKVIVYGHSMGAGVATKLCKFLCMNGSAPDGLVLEAPFNNAKDAVKHNAFVKPYRLVPVCLRVYLRTCDEQGIYFKSDESISHVTCAILIMHDVRDLVVPYCLGDKLYRCAVESRSPTSGPVDLHTFTGCGHNFIHRATCYQDVIRNFISKLH